MRAWATFTVLLYVQFHGCSPKKESKPTRPEVLVLLSAVTDSRFKNSLSDKQVALLKKWEQLPKESLIVSIEIFLDGAYREEATASRFLGGKPFVEVNSMNSDQKKRFVRKMSELYADKILQLYSDMHLNG